MQPIRSSPPACNSCGNALGGARCDTLHEAGGAFAVVRSTCIACRDAELFHGFMLRREVSTMLLANLAIGVYPESPGLGGLWDRIFALDSADGPWLRRGIHSLTSEAYRRDFTSLRLFDPELRVATLEFQGRVWFDAGLGDFIRAQEDRGLSGRFRCWHGAWSDPTYTGTEVDIRCYSMAGRFLIAFEVAVRGPADDPAPGTSVSFVTEEESRFHRMGWSSCGGTADDVLKLCKIATYGWGRGEACQHFDRGERIDWGLSPDSSVSLL